MEVNAYKDSLSTEPSCELAASSSQNSLPGGSSLVCLREDIPGEFLKGRESSQLHGLKCWLKYRAATIVGKKQDLVKQ